MKNGLKILLIFFIGFFLFYSLGSYTYLKTHNKENRDYYSEKYEGKENLKKNINGKEKIIANSLESAIKSSSRVNFILLGMEGDRTDVIIFISFDQKNNKVDMISIPRDTYLYRKGYDEAELRKINAIYYSHGVNGVKKAVEYIIYGVPVHHYIVVDYEGVEKIVDSIGGVEVTVPFHMKYSDPTSDPPLYIDIPKGKQVLNGKQAVKFLRYRKSNNNQGGYKDGDLGRIKAQQEFIQSAMKKALGVRLPKVIKTAFNYVKTDVELSQVLIYAKNCIGMTNEDIQMMTLPGEGIYKTIEGKTLSYFIYDKEETKILLEDLYGVQKKQNVAVPQ